jgi:hypothetical protein
MAQVWKEVVQVALLVADEANQQLQQIFHEM